jgi:predicted NAD/FAD-binding protein
MSFSVRIEPDGVEWAGTSVPALFAQKSNLVRPEFWTMLRDILRFNSHSSDLVERGLLPTGSLGEFLDRGAYGPAFRDWYLLPMAAAIWSCPTQQMAAYPAATSCASATTTACCRSMAGRSGAPCAVADASMCADSPPA